jgi:hypothetical protein
MKPRPAIFRRSNLDRNGSSLLSTHCALDVDIATSRKDVLASEAFLSLSIGAMTMAVGYSGYFSS